MSDLEEIIENAKQRIPEGYQLLIVIAPGITAIEFTSDDNIITEIDDIDDLQEAIETALVMMEMASHDPGGQSSEH